MNNRNATDTIKGYFYQFDYSIRRLLELVNDTESIIVEKIEDVDIKTATSETAVQCKYYSKTEYNHSVIAKPIRFMLSHYKELKNSKKETINYLLYGYYSGRQDKLVVPLSIDDLKDKFLTYTRAKVKHCHHNEINATDDELNEFLSLLSIDINAKSYNTQLDEIFAKLQVIFKCNEFEAEHYYYNNALKIIKDISTESDVLKRTISKKTFIDNVNTKSILFNYWFIEYKGLEKHFRELRKQYFTKLNISPFDRFFLIEANHSNYKRSELKELIFLISKKWCKITKRTTAPFCPYLYINGIDDSELINLKNELSNEGFIFIDGFDFSGASFNVKSITKKPDYHNGIKIKFINEKSFIGTIISESSSTKEVFQFYLNVPYYSNDLNSLKHVKIQIDDIKHIKEII